MTTPDGLTAEAEALLADMHDPRFWFDQRKCEGFNPVRRCTCGARTRIAAIEAAAVARHVRETGCERLREAAEEAASWLELRPDYTEGDAATASRLRAALAASTPSPEACSWAGSSVPCCEHEDLLSPHCWSCNPDGPRGYQPATSEEGDGRYTSTIPLRTYSERTGR